MTVTESRSWWNAITVLGYIWGGFFARISRVRRRIMRKLCLHISASCTSSINVDWRAYGANNIV